jgi:hypothetical protein
MTKKILNTLAGLILLFAVAAPLQAGSILNPEMTVTVPFEFAAGDKVLPAGDYTVQVNPEREASSCGEKDTDRKYSSPSGRNHAPSQYSASLSSNGTALAFSS